MILVDLEQLQNSDRPLRLPDTGENVRTLFLKLPQEHTLKTLKPGDKAWLIFFAEAGVLYPGDGSYDACGQVLEENSASMAS